MWASVLVLMWIWAVFAIWWNTYKSLCCEVQFRRKQQMAHYRSLTQQLLHDHSIPNGTSQSSIPCTQKHHSAMYLRYLTNHMRHMALLCRWKQALQYTCVYMPFAYFALMYTPLLVSIGVASLSILFLWLVWLTPYLDRLPTLQSTMAAGVLWLQAQNISAGEQWLLLRCSSQLPSSSFPHHQDVVTWAITLWLQTPAPSTTSETMTEAVPEYAELSI